MLRPAQASLPPQACPDSDRQLQHGTHSIRHASSLSAREATFSSRTCPDSTAGLIHSHLWADVQGSFWLLACGGLSCCYHSCRMGAGRYRAGTHRGGWVQVRPWSCGAEGSGGGAEDGDSSASLVAQTHGPFGAPRRPERRKMSREFRGEHMRGCQC